MTIFFQGDLVRLSGVWTNINNALTDPAAVTFRIQRLAPAPADPEVVYVYDIDIELVRDSLGTYHVDYVLPAGGTWSYRFAGVGNVTKSMQEEFYVTPANPA